MKKGFTLVELSIVLVIIGLLIGGILVAQSMISTAKIQGFVQQITQFDAAITNYQTAFGGLPGDVAATGCVEYRNICGDGVIQDSHGNGNGQPTINSTYVVDFDAEVANFWPQLQLAGLKNPEGAFTPTITGNFSIQGNSPNSPKAKIGKNTGVMPYWDSNGPAAHYYYLADWSAVNSGSYAIDPSATYAKPSISAADAAAFDSKIDDGYPQRPWTPGLNVGEGFSGASCTSGGLYNSGNSAALCTLFVRMGSRVAGN